MKLRIVITAGAALALAACGAGSGGGTTITFPATTPATTPAETTTTTAAATTTTGGGGATTTSSPTTTAGADQLEAVVDVFETWVGHIAAGDHQAVWELLAEDSREAIDEDTFFQSTVFELSEGWGAWTQAENVTYRLEHDEDDDDADDDDLVLVISGTVTQEGTTEDREVRMSLDEDDGRWFVDPFEHLD